MSLLQPKKLTEKRETKTFIVVSMPFPASFEFSKVWLAVCLNESMMVSMHNVIVTLRGYFKFASVSICIYRGYILS